MGRIGAVSNPQPRSDVWCLSPSPADVSQGLIVPSSSSGTVPGNIAPDVRNGKATRVSDMPQDYRLQIEFVFKLRNADQFQQCLNSISDPSSPNYEHFLNGTTLQPYLPTPGQRASVARYLASHGFDVRFGSSPLVLMASGNVSTAESTFGVRVGLYRGFYSADSDPTLPLNLADLVNSVLGLDNITRVRHLETPCSGPYCPQGLQVGYSFTSLYGNGFDGTGQKVAVVDEPGDPLIQTSINTYSSQYSLPSTTITLVYPDGAPTTYDLSWAAETAIDVEAVHAVSPGAQIVLLYDSVDLMNAIDYVATNHVANIVSNSWLYICINPSHLCSDTQLAAQQPALVSSVDSRLAVDASQGLTILFASGDNGAQPDGTTFGTEFPASDPNVLAVGGTNLYLAGCGTTTCTGYDHETGWFNSGGGYSSYFAEPSWQTSTIGTKSGRAVPDISMLGYIPGIWIYSAYTISCSGASGAGWFSCTGTSLSTPLWAGFLAIVLQMRGGSALGNLGPKLYQLASSSSYASDFHDITVGNNGYPATTGWDPITGWGTPIANNLAADLSSAAGFDFSISNSGGIAISQGPNSGSNTITVTLVSGSTQSVSLSCASGLPTGASCSFNPASGNPTFTSTLTITITSSTPKGGYSVTVAGTGGGRSRSTGFTLTVTGPPTLSVGSWPVAGVPIKYNITGALLTGATNFTISQSSTFTVSVLAAPNTYTQGGVAYYFDHWALDGGSLGASNMTENIQVGGSQPGLRNATAIYSTSQSSISTLQAKVIQAAALSVWHILPDYNGPVHTPLPKCCGVIPAELSDFTATGFLVGAEGNDQYMILDTSNLIDQTSGRPTGTITGTIVTFGGPIVNQVVYYYEHASGTDASPIYFAYSNGMDQFKDRAGVVKAQISTSTIATGNSDIFLIEVFKDSTGRIVVIMYGMGWKGTYGAGLYFKSQILPHLSNFLGHWIIVSWTDASSGVSNNGLPDFAGGDTYTTIASG